MPALTHRRVRNGFNSLSTGGVDVKKVVKHSNLCCMPGRGLQYNNMQISNGGIRKRVGTGSSNGKFATNVTIGRSFGAKRAIARRVSDTKVMKDKNGNPILNTTGFTRGRTFFNYKMIPGMNFYNRSGVCCNAGDGICITNNKQNIEASENNRKNVEAPVVEVVAAKVIALVEAEAVKAANPIELVEVVATNAAEATKAEAAAKAAAKAKAAEAAEAAKAEAVEAAEAVAEAVAKAKATAKAEAAEAAEAAKAEATAKATAKAEATAKAAAKAAAEAEAAEAAAEEASAAEATAKAEASAAEAAAKAEAEAVAAAVAAEAEAAAVAAEAEAKAAAEAVAEAKAEAKAEAEAAEAKNNILVLNEVGSPKILTNIIHKVKNIINDIIQQYPTRYEIDVYTEDLEDGTLGYADWEGKYVVLNTKIINNGHTTLLNGSPQPTAVSVLIHEIFHMFGLVGLVDSKNLTTKIGDRTFYIGDGGVSGYKKVLKASGKPLPPTEGIPLEDEYGPGTELVHFEEGITRYTNPPGYPILQNEIMTGFLDYSNYITDMTTGLFLDIGFKINESSSHVFTQPVSGHEFMWV